MQRRCDEVWAGRALVDILIDEIVRRSFPDFAPEFVDTDFVLIFVRRGGKGPPLLVLHGYPQTHAMGHRVAPDLAERFRLSSPTRPSTASSDAPAGDRVHKPYTKRDAIIYQAKTFDLKSVE